MKSSVLDKDLIFKEFRRMMFNDEFNSDELDKLIKDGRVRIWSIDEYAEFKVEFEADLKNITKDEVIYKYCNEINFALVNMGYYEGYSKKLDAIIELIV